LVSKIPLNEENPSALSRENSRLRGDLLTIAHRISHDLKTPLGAIIMSAEALKEILTETDSSALSLVISALNSADESSVLIKHVSFVLKATACPQNFQPINMGEPLSRAMQRLESRIQNNETKVSGPDSWPVVNGVLEWLEVVWEHLLVNSLRQCLRNKIKLGWDARRGEIKFWLADNGVAVPEDRRAGLFQRFDELHKDSAIQSLELSIVQRLVELQHGQCGYESTPEGCPCFFFVLPVG
jgi:K+-sensing histidine kinase KdpD